MLKPAPDVASGGRRALADVIALEEDVPPFLQSPRQFIPYYLRHRAGGFATLFLCVAAAAICAVGVQYAMKLLVDAMADPQQKAIVWTILAVFIGLIAAESVFWRLSGWLTCRTTIAAGVDMRLDLFDYLNGQSMRYFAENLAGSLGQRVTATAGNFGAMVNTVVWRILPPAIDFLGAMLVFTTIEPGMMAALALFVVFVTGLLIRFGRRGRPLHSDYAAKAGEVAGELVDVIGNMWAVKAFSARNREWGRLARLFDDEAVAQRRSWMFTERARVIHDIALWAMAATMLSWALYLWDSGRISAGDVVIVSAFTFRILHGSRDLAIALIDTTQHFGFIEDTLSIIAQKRSVADAPAASGQVPQRGDIRFDHVSFAYGTGRRDAIHDLDVSIEAGSSVGIVGASGAGKSTFVALLQRLYDVDRGDIRIDGRSLRDMKQDSLRAAMAVVPQEISLFHRSVYDNIAFGRPDATEDEVREAARLAACDGFIQGLPQGFDTMVGERGVKLSGGQRQRIGIARAFLKRAPIIILDEATSALDSEAEAAVQASLLHLPGHPTIVAVAHRLSTLAQFDRVLVFQDGQIVEDGPPAELVESAGAFAKMWHRQAGSFAAKPARDGLRRAVKLGTNA